MPGALKRWARAGLALLAMLVLALAPSSGPAVQAVPFPAAQTHHAVSGPMPCHDAPADAGTEVPGAPSGPKATPWASCCHPAVPATLPAPLPWGVPLNSLQASLHDGTHPGKPGIAPLPVPPPPRRVLQSA